LALCIQGVFHTAASELDIP